ncbi:TIGR03773 family transporter-associated surface protein [Arthrobacter sp. NPDC080073]|uniref:TIGR03773 family transporter-associated surface protein n=1 Tax=Arthrobacter sp. NPDC080073 TaxID=3155919 RepID=UPI00342079A5
MHLRPVLAIALTAALTLAPLPATAEETPAPAPITAAPTPSTPDSPTESRATKSEPAPIPTPEPTPEATPAPTPSAEATRAPEPTPAPVPEQTLQAPTTTRQAEAQNRTVLSAGEVQIASRIENGRVAYRLVNADGADLDPAQTVLQVANPEPWPGTTGDAATWERIAPEHGAVYRTAGGGATANPLSLILDTSGIPTDAVYGLLGGPKVYTRLGLQPNEPRVGLLVGGTDYWGTTHEQVEHPWVRISAGSGALYPAQQTLSLAFTEPGRACVPFQTNLQLTDGTFLNHDVALTVAVGDTDPAAIEPCPQPDAIPAQGPTPLPSTTTGTTVLDSGIAFLGSTLTGSALNLGVITSDRGRTTSYDPSKTVFSLPRQDAQWPGTGWPATSGTYQDWERIAKPGTRLWRSAGLYEPQIGGAQPNDLVLDFAAFLDGDALNEEKAVLGVGYELTGATTTGDGYLASYRYSDSYEGLNGDGSGAAFWDSRPGGRHEAQPVSPWSWMNDPFYTLKSELGGAPATGFAFSAAGVYCVGVRASTVLADGTPRSTHTTFTFAVGIDPATVSPCAQTGDPGEGPTDPTTPRDPEDRDPTVRWSEKGHLDLALRQDGEGGLEFATGDGPASELTPLADSVWVGRGEYATFRVPEPDELQDYTFIGPPGSSYHGFTQGGNYQNRTLWPGLSMLYLPDGFSDHDATWRMSKVSGPGDVLVWSTSSEYLNSRTRVSSWFPIGRTHVHENWAFTQPGVYCLRVEAKVRPASDPESDLVASGVLTVAVGDVDLSTVQPCERAQPVPPIAPQRIEQVSSDRTVYTETKTQGNGSMNTLELTEVGGRMDVVAGLTRPIGTATQYVNPEHVVYSLNPGGDGYSLTQRIATAVDGPALSGDVRLRTGKVTGPGDWWLTARQVSDQFATALDTRTATASSETTLRGGTAFGPAHSVSAGGVYCLPLTWSGKTAAGASFQVTKTLTFAAGVAPAGVTLCAEGGEGTEPTDPGTLPRPDPGPMVWDVTNQTRTDSGATILNVGHVDVASRLIDGKLRTLIKDDTTGDTTYRDPSRTVLQLRPGAETTVPGADAFRFLGKAGARVWQVEEVQHEGLLWPGWSTEQIDRGLIPGGVDWKLDRVQGPGEFALYQSGVFGVPNVLFNTRDGVTGADRFTIPDHVHAHGTWTFSAEGVYCLGFTRSAALANGARVSDAFVLAYAVGKVNVKGIDPAACFTEPPGKPGTADTTPVNPAQLTDANTGGVQVLDGADGFTPGQLVTVQVGAEHAGQWVSVWLHSATNPVWLGWAHVGASGAAQVRLPADTPTAAHLIVIKDRDGALVGWDSLSLLPAPQAPARPGAPGADATPASQQVTATQCKAGATILSSGHVDYSSRIVGGKLRSLIGDDTSGSKVYREPAGTILWLKPSSRVTLPGGYGQVGQAGSSVWQVPQTQNPNLIWMGWNTEALNAGNTRGPVSWTIDSISGPGEVKVYLSSAFGGVQRMVFNNGGNYSIPLGVHAHANWAFSAEGVYRIRTTQTATLTNGQASSDIQTLTIVVGNVDPATAAGGSGTGCGTVSNAVLLTDDEDGAMKAAEQAAAAAAAARTVLPGKSATGDDGGFTDPFTALAQGNPVPLLLSILGLLFLAGAGGAGALWWRRQSGARGGVSA